MIRIVAPWCQDHRFEERADERHRLARDHLWSPPPGSPRISALPISRLSTPPGTCPLRTATLGANFSSTHIPGAIFFDIDAIADPSSGLPHMLPSPESLCCGPRGHGRRRRPCGSSSTIRMGLYSAPRVWWTFRTFGAERVAVLDGGLPALDRRTTPARIWRTVPTADPVRSAPAARSGRGRAGGAARVGRRLSPDRRCPIGGPVSRRSSGAQGRAPLRPHAGRPEPALRSSLSTMAGLLARAAPQRPCAGGDRSRPSR